MKDDNARFLSPTVPKQRSIKSLKKPLMSPGSVSFTCMLLPMLLRYHVPGCLPARTTRVLPSITTVIDYLATMTHEASLHFSTYLFNISEVIQSCKAARPTAPRPTTPTAPGPTTPTPTAPGPTTPTAPAVSTAQPQPSPAVSTAQPQPSPTVSQVPTPASSSSTPGNRTSAPPAASRTTGNQNQTTHSIMYLLIISFSSSQTLCHLFSPAPLSPGDSKVGCHN